MAVFYILLLFPMIIQHITVKEHRIPFKKRNERALVFFFVFFTFLAMLRHKSVGNDTEHYMFYFNKFSHSTWGEVRGYSLENGFSYFVKLVSVFSDEPQLFLAVSAMAVSAMAAGRGWWRVVMPNTNNPNSGP